MRKSLRSVDGLLEVHDARISFRQRRGARFAQEGLQGGGKSPACTASVEPPWPSTLYPSLRLCLGHPRGRSRCSGVESAQGSRSSGLV